MQTSLRCPDDPPRILCPVPISKGVTLYTCGLCAWVFRVEGSDMTAGQAAFDAHRCEDFPRRNDCEGVVSMASKWLASSSVFRTILLVGMAVLAIAIVFVVMVFRPPILSFAVRYDH